MSEWGLSTMAETVELVVSELVTNAVQASTSPNGRSRYTGDAAGLPIVYLRLLSDRTRLLVEVWDQGDGMPTLKQTEADEEDGRGLLLVDALCVRWSWHSSAGWPGKVVWAELQAEQEHRTRCADA